jgi:hypothetical protein
MSQVTPSKVLAEVSAVVPAACRENIVIRFYVERLMES